MGFQGYGVEFMNQFYNLPPKAVTFSQLIGVLIPAVLGGLVGLLVDIWGAGKMHVLSIFLGCVVAPVPLFFWWTHVEQSSAVSSVYIGQAILGVLLSLTVSLFVWVVELFPVRLRTTGAAMLYNIGVGIFGGLGL